MIDLPPPADLWLPSKPAIIRPIEQKLLRPGFLPSSRHDRRAALRDLVSRGVLTPEQAKRALVGFFVPAVGWPVGGGAPVEVAFIGPHLGDGSNQSTYTYADVPIGAAHPTRRVFVVFHWGMSSDGSDLIVSATIGGIAATIHVQADSGGLRGAGIISAKIPTGTTATVSVTMTETIARSAMGVYRSINEANSAPTDMAETAGASTSVSTTIDVEDGGFALAAATADAVGSHTWNDLAENYEDTIEDSSFRFSAALSSDLAAETDRVVEVEVAGSLQGPTGLAVLSWR